MNDDAASWVPRRSFLKGTIAGTVLSSPLAQQVVAADRPDQARGVIPQENARPGADDWQLTRVRVDGKGFRSPWIEAYCSRQSVKAGDSIEVMVSTDPARQFRLELFRMGYYGGKGARLVKTFEPMKGKTQPTPEPGEKALHECR